VSADAKFLALGEELPPEGVMPPGLNFLPYRRVGNLLVVSGLGPQWGREFRYLGKLGRDLSVGDGYAAARLTTLNILQVVRKALGSLDAVEQFVEVLGMVNSASGFTDQPRVMNGCSDCLVELFGDPGKHARAAVGMAELPFNLSVEIKVVIEAHKP